MELAEQWAPSPPTLAAFPDLQIALLSLLDLPLDQLEVLLDIGLRRRRHLRKQEAAKQGRLREVA